MNKPEAFGEGSTLSFVDRFGVYLSSQRLHKEVRNFRGLRVADFGCGYHATFARTILSGVQSMTLADLKLDPELAADPKVLALQGDLLESLSGVPDQSLDVVMCISVLEHLEDPSSALEHFKRITAPGGVVLINVPSWRGEYFLELSAFRLGLSVGDSIDDHKCYFDPRDLWPLLVRAGFRPKNISCFKHKFGLNTFAVCRT